MAVKNISTRMKICGRMAKCTGGHSAVEQSGGISQEIMHSEYDGKTYYPKYAEDLVHNEVLLPENAPEEYKDPKKLWNSVEMFEKKDDAQLARTWRIELPNNWTYKFAIMFLRELCKRLFVSKGMCVQFAIHDSENDKGQRNLHAHIMLTRRSIDEQGHWMPKQKKVYLTDENGKRIPVIDEKTGQQKVDKQNHKQWKCTTISINDWNSRENVRMWRKDHADTINAVNERIGQTENHWEYRSFKEQGIDMIPQIHLGPRASAMERKGIRTERGDINREIMAQNAVITAAKSALIKAEPEFEKIRKAAGSVAEKLSNEIFDMIKSMAERYNNRLKLPIVGAKYIRKIPNRARLQDKGFMEGFVLKMGWGSFDEIGKTKKALESEHDKLVKGRTEDQDRIAYLEGLLALHELYEPYQRINAEYWKLKKAEEKTGRSLGFGSKSKAQECKRQHQTELNMYKMYRDMLKEKIREADKMISPKRWREEIAALRAALEGSQQEYSDTVWQLACIETLEYNKKDFGRMLENERHQQSREHARDRNNNR